MGVIGGFVGFYSFKGLMGMTKSMPVSAFLAAWLACVIPALAASFELFFAGTFPLIAGMIGMGIYHAIIGVVEGIVTVAVIYLIMNVRPDLLDAGTKTLSGA
jgi:cobalt/nickel transport system permease protein